MKSSHSKLKSYRFEVGTSEVVRPNSEKSGSGKKHPSTVSALGQHLVGGRETKLGPQGRSSAEDHGLILGQNGLCDTRVQLKEMREVIKVLVGKLQ